MVEQEYLDKDKEGLEKKIENSNDYISYLSKKHIIKEEDLDESELVTLAKRYKRNRDLTTSIIFIVVGFPLIVLLVGIIFIVYGAINISKWVNNSYIKHECVAWSPSRKQIILFESHNVIYGFDPREIKYISHDANDKMAKAVVRFNDREKFYYLGISTYEEVQSCNFELGKLQKQVNDE